MAEILERYGFLVAAYALALGALLGYGLHLARERRRLLRALSRGGARDRG